MMMWSVGPFGRLRWHDGGDGSLVEGSELFGFAGHQYDAGTGPYYMRAATSTRPGAASPSPTARPGPGAGHESTYLYAGGSPLSMVEPTGLRAAKEESVRQQNEAIFAAERGEDMSVMDRVDAWADSLSLLEGAEILAGFTPLGAVSTPVARRRRRRAGQVAEGDPLRRLRHQGKPPMKPPGFDSGAGHQRRHLLGKALGGGGRDPGNIATLTRTANNSYMRSYEEAIGRAMAQGETVAVSVRLGYQNGAVPASITIVATGDRGVSIFGTFPNVP